MLLTFILDMCDCIFKLSILLIYFRELSSCKWSQSLLVKHEWTLTLCKDLLILISDDVHLHRLSFQSCSTVVLRKVSHDLCL